MVKIVEGRKNYKMRNSECGLRMKAWVRCSLLVAVVAILEKADSEEKCRLEAGERLWSPQLIRSLLGQCKRKGGSENGNEAKSRFNYNQRNTLTWLQVGSDHGWWRSRRKNCGPGNTPEIENHYKAPKAIDAHGCLIMPGLVNAHTHAAMTCYRGMADDLPLMEWLTQFVFPAEAKSDGDQVYWSTLLACAEMIRSGTTTFCDMYLFEDRVAEAAKKAGIRAVVGEVLYDFPSPHYGPIERGLEFTESLIKGWQKDPLITIAIEPHALYTCSPDLLKKCRLAIGGFYHIFRESGKLKKLKTYKGL
jgi:hypothetical protein